MKQTIADLNKKIEEKEREIKHLDRLFLGIKKILWGDDSYRHEPEEIRDEIVERSHESIERKIVLREKIKLLTKENLRLWHLVRGKMGDKTLREEGLFRQNFYET